MQDELIEIAERMAQELRDIISDAETAGSVDPFPATQALLEEWESIYKQVNT